MFLRKFSQFEQAVDDEDERELALVISHGIMTLELILEKYQSFLQKGA